MQVILHWRTYYKTLEIQFYGSNSKMLTKSHTNEDHLFIQNAVWKQKHSTFNLIWIHNETRLIRAIQLRIANTPNPGYGSESGTLPVMRMIVSSIGKFRERYHWKCGIRNELTRERLMINSIAGSCKTLVFYIVA